ncbi:MAG: acetamidase/formamidase family protein [Candidatus Bathyarchaeia archaeon]
MGAKEQIESKGKIHQIRITADDRAKNDPVCHNRFDAAIPPILKVDPGDIVSMQTRDFLDNQPIEPGFTAEKIPQMDTTLAHPLTGPIYVNGAKAGDVLEVEVLDVNPGPVGWTLIYPGLSPLRDVFPKPWLSVWDTSAKTHALCKDLPKVRIPARQFMGVMGVAFSEEKQEEVLEREKALRDAYENTKSPPQVWLPSPKTAIPANVIGEGSKRADKGLRTFPPRENGGNFDNKLLRPGAKILYPVFKEGGLFSSGDAHFSQGEGEVSVAMEMRSTATFRFNLRKGMADRINWQPIFELPPGLLQRESYSGSVVCTIGLPIKKKGEVIPQYEFLKGVHGSYGPLTNVGEDLNLAARNALINMIDYLCKEKNLTPEQAYALMGFVGEFRISTYIDVPNYCVTFGFPMDIFLD